MKNAALGATQSIRIEPRSDQIGVRSKAKKPGSDFKSQLVESLGDLKGLKFSSHAAQRLESREMDMTPEKARRLCNAVETAKGKGAKESLVLLDELAFVVSVRNNTVITACDRNGLKEGVFTKIDSAIFG